MKMKSISGWILFCAGFLTLCSLGLWQYQRLQWKSGIIERLNQVYEVDPASHMLEERELHEIKAGELIIKSGFIYGMFQPEGITFWPRVYQGNYGFDMLRLVKTRDGTSLLVNTGWVPEDIMTHRPILPPLSPPQGEIKLSGLYRTIDYHPYALNNNVQKNLWYRFEPQVLSEYLQVTGLAPGVLFLQPISEQGWLGEINQLRWYPRNKHQEYMLFWFGMALIWAVLFTIFRLKKGKRNKAD